MRKLKLSGYILITLGALGIVYFPFAVGVKPGISEFEILQLVSTLVVFMSGISMVQLTRSIGGMRKFIRYSFPTALLICATGIFFKLNSMPGAGIKLVLSIFFLCFAVTPVLGKIRYERWRSMVTSTWKIIGLMVADSLGLAFMMIAMLMRFLHWPGSMILWLTGIGLIVFSLIAWSGLFELLFKKQQSAQKELEQSFELLNEKNTEILDSIAYAKRIQTAILPPDRVVKEYLSESFILYKPKDVVAGDFYWMETIDQHVYFAAADCTGHGVPGAMVSVICVNGLNRSVREFGLREPGKILDRTRELVIKEFEKSEEEVKDGMDISLCALNTETNELIWAGAHNPLWIVTSRQQLAVSEDAESRKLTADGRSLYEVKADKQPIGQYHKTSSFTTHTLQLEKGDTIYVFSDGYPDQFGGEKGKKYKSGNFKKKLLEISKEPIEKQRELLDEEFEQWRGDLEQIDDVCVIGVRV